MSITNLRGRKATFMYKFSDSISASNFRAQVNDHFHNVRAQHPFESDGHGKLNTHRVLIVATDSISYNDQVKSYSDKLADELGGVSILKVNGNFID